MTTKWMIDEVDFQILNSLIADSTKSNKEIGQEVHLTGQAVGSRIRKLQDMGVIDGYTVRWNPDKIGQTIHAFITVFMKTSSSHQKFHQFVSVNTKVNEVHRVTSEGCYWLRAYFQTQNELNEFLNELLNFGNYKLSLSIERLK